MVVWKSCLSVWLFSFFKKLSSILYCSEISSGVSCFSVSKNNTGSGYKWGFNVALSKFFPNSSPVFHRSIFLEGMIQKSDSEKFYLKTADNLWTLKPKNSNINLTKYLSLKVQILGNLTRENNLVEVSEVIPLETLLTSPTISNPPPASSNPAPSDMGLPELYFGLSWETNQKRVLIFTSGKRKIEQEGVYLESSQITNFPQDFINYYLTQLKDKGFKETLNSINPDGITITYATGDLFLTFGTKNVYKGSGDKKQLTGYKAFIEHN